MPRMLSDREKLSRLIAEAIPLAQRVRESHLKAIEACTNEIIEAQDAEIRKLRRVVQASGGANA